MEKLLLSLSLLAVMGFNLSAQTPCQAGILNGPFTDSSNFYPNVYVGNKITVHKTSVIRYFRAGNLGTADSLKMALFEHQGGHVGKFVVGSETKAISGDSIRLKSQYRVVVPPGKYYLMGVISGGGLDEDFTLKELTLKYRYYFPHSFDQPWPHLRGMDSSCCYQYNFWLEMQCCPFIDTLQITTCRDYTSPSGKVFNSSGVYYDTILPQPYMNCDSIVLIDLKIKRPHRWLHITDYSLRTTYKADRYQWIDCDTRLRVPGATDSIYVDSTGGKYAVILEKDGCIDTSHCYSINGLGLGNNELRDLKLYPNPTDGVVHIETSYDQVEIHAFSVTGQKIKTNLISTPTGYKLLLPDEPGMYLVQIKAQHNLKTYSILRK